MKAAVLTNNNKPLKVLDDIQCPALKHGQVLVEIAFSGVCHSQLMEIKGYRGDDPYLLTYLAMRVQESSTGWERGN